MKASSFLIYQTPKNDGEMSFYLRKVFPNVNFEQFQKKIYMYIVTITLILITFVNKMN